MKDIEVLPAAAAGSAAFDYAGLDSETRIVVQQRTSEIKTIARRAASDVIEIGQKLIEVKERLGHGNFTAWLDKEFAWSQDTAGRFMSVASRFGQIPHGAEFAPKALYLLAAPSIPEEARTEAIQRAEAGERITVPAARSIIAEHMAGPDELKPDALAWARSIDPKDPRGVLQQIVITNSPVGVSHFERLGDYLRARGHRFMRADVKTAVQRLIEDLAMPAPKVVILNPPVNTPPIDVSVPPTPTQSAPARSRCKICGRPLSDPGSIARGAGDVCSGHGSNGDNGRATAPGRTVIFNPAPAGDSDPEPQVEEPDIDLPAIVLTWLDEQVDNADLADEKESRIVWLEQIAKARNGFGSPTGSEAWRQLRNFHGWPADVDVEQKARAVRLAILRLKGVDPEDTPDSTTEEHAQATTEPNRRHSWDGVKPAAGGTRASPRPGSDTYNTLLDRKTEHVERGLKAALAFRKWADVHQAALDEDAGLAEVFALSEDFRIQAMCLD